MKIIIIVIERSSIFLIQKENVIVELMPNSILIRQYLCNAPYENIYIMQSVSDLFTLLRFHTWNMSSICPANSRNWSLDPL